MNRRKLLGALASMPVVGAFVGGAMAHDIKQPHVHPIPAPAGPIDEYDGMKVVVVSNGEVIAEKHYGQVNVMAGDTVHLGDLTLGIPSE